MPKTSITCQKRYKSFITKALNKCVIQANTEFIKAFDVQLIYLTFPFDLEFYKKKRALERHIDRSTFGYKISIGYIEYASWDTSNENPTSIFQVVYSICSPDDQFSKKIAQTNIIDLFTRGKPRSSIIELSYPTEYGQLVGTRKKIQASVIDHIMHRSKTPSKFRRLLKKYEKEGLL